jgi:hypothetical protein
MLDLTFQTVEGEAIALEHLLTTDFTLMILLRHLA